MFIRIATLTEKKFIGKYLSMSFADNKTFELWRAFMPRRKEIQNIIGNELYAIEVYPSQFFQQFNPAAEFKKWAAVEVTDFECVPNDMDTLIAPAGLHAVFLHKGPVIEGPKTYRYIFDDWLPQSDYLLADRPHFAVMGDKYKPDSSASEEEIWIPVDKK